MANFAKFHEVFLSKGSFVARRQRNHWGSESHASPKFGMVRRASTLLVMYFTFTLTRESKKQDTLVLPITLPNVD